MQKNLFNKPLEVKLPSREETKVIAQKAKQAPQQQSIVTIRQAAGQSDRQVLIQRVESAISIAKSKLVEDPTLELIHHEARYMEYIEHCCENGVAGLDTETMGLDPIVDRMVGACLYTPNETAMYVPMHHIDYWDKELKDQLSDNVVRKGLEMLIKYKVKLYYHNAKFDIRVLSNSMGIGYMPVHWDTQLAGKYMNENDKPHKLKPMWGKFVGNENMSDMTFDKVFEGIPFGYVPPEIGYLYAAKDPKYTLELAQYQEQFLVPDAPKCRRQNLVDAATFFRDTEIPLVEYVAEMEDRGVALDEDQCLVLSAEQNVKLKVFERRLHDFTDMLDLRHLDPELRNKLDRPVNLNSPVQMAIIFYDVLGCHSVDRKSPRGTGEEIIAKFIQKGTIYESFFNDILEYRGIVKLLGTYLDKMPRIQKKRWGVYGRIHGQFHQYGAETGRFSSSGPNLQNIPKGRTRSMFRATDGHYLIGSDYSQQEPRVLAHMSGDEGMINAYLSGLDLYSWIASEVYGVPYEECKEKWPDKTDNYEGKKRRTSMKEIVLGIMYGRGEKSIAEKLKISKDEAKRITDLFFNRFPKVKLFLDQLLNSCFKQGYTMTAYGRKRRLPETQLPEFEFCRLDKRTRITKDDPEWEICQYYDHILKNTYKYDEKKDLFKEITDQHKVWTIDNGAKIAGAQREAMNSVIQGTSADITKKAMLAIGRSQELRDLGYRMIMTIHDEVVGECPKANVKTCIAIIERLMIEAPTDKIKVPMKVDVDVTEVWYGEEIAV